MNTRFLVNWIGMFLAAVLTSSLTGCVHTSTIALDDLSESLDKDIVVITHDGNKTRYNAGSFEVAMSDSGRILRSKGSVGDDQAGFSAGRQATALAFTNITIVETREKTGFYYMGAILVGFVVVVLLGLHGVMKQ